MLETNRGSSLLIKSVQKFDIKDKVEVPLQTDINKYNIGATDTIKRAETTIELKSKNGGDKLTYEVSQYSNTIIEPIRFYLDGVFDYDKGYQRKAVFPMIYRKSDSKLFIFTNIEHSEIFIDRIEELKKNIVLKDTYFDFEDFKLIPEIKNIWGVWEKVNLAHKKTNASFGTQVDKSVDVELSRATSINLKMEIDGKTYTLSISKDGRISSSQRLKKEELLNIFDKYFKKYLKE